MKESNMKSLVFRIMILAIAATLVTGCDQSSNKYVNELKHYKQPPDTDVTRLPKYNFSSFSGTVWKTKVKTALVHITLYTGKHVISLFTPDAFDQTDPNYRPVPGMKIVSVLPKGIRLRIGELMKDNGIGGQYWVIATLENGTNYQQNIYISPNFFAKNRFIWEAWSSSTNWDVNSNMLEAVTNAP